MKLTLEALLKAHQVFIEKAIKYHLYPDTKDVVADLDLNEPMIVIVHLIKHVELVEANISTQRQTESEHKNRLFELELMLEGAGNSYIDPESIQKLRCYLSEDTLKEYEEKSKTTGIWSYFSTYINNPNEPLIKAVCKKRQELNNSSVDVLMHDTEKHCRLLLEWFPDCCNAYLRVLFEKVARIDTFSKELETLFSGLAQLEDDKERLESINSKKSLLEQSYEQLYAKEQIDHEIQRLDLYFKFFKQWQRQSSFDGKKLEELIAGKQKDLEDIQNKLNSLKNTTTQTVNQLNKIEQLFEYRSRLSQIEATLPSKNDREKLEFIECFNKTKMAFKTEADTKAVKDVHDSCVQAEQRIQCVYDTSRRTIYKEEYSSLKEQIEKIDGLKPGEHTQLYDRVLTFKKKYQSLIDPSDETIHCDEKLKNKIQMHTAKVQLFRDLINEFYGADENKIAGRFGTYISVRENEAGFWVKELFRSILEFVFGVFGYQSDWSARKQYIRDLRETMKDQRDNEDTDVSVADFITILDKCGIDRFKPRSDSGDEFNKSLKAVVVDLRDKLQPLVNANQPSKDASLDSEAMPSGEPATLRV